MTTHLLPRNADLDAPFDDLVLTRPQIIWRARYTIVGVSLLIAAATWAVSAFLPGTYRASSDVLVGGRGAVASVDFVNGANGLATQYAQFAGTETVLADAAQRAQAPVGEVAAGTLVTTVANTNIVRITVTADSSAAASRRAAAVSQALIAQAKKMSDGQGVDPEEVKQIDRLLAQAKADVVRLTETLASAKPDSSRAVATTTSLNNAQQQVLALTLKRVDVLAQAGRENGNRAALSSLTVEPGAAKIAPRPLLNASVGLIAALIIMTELAVVSERRRHPDYRGRRHRPTLAG